VFMAVNGCVCHACLLLVCVQGARGYPGAGYWLVF
jgi:hypothetical protein